ncbi:MAG: CoA transferase [Chloroflexi bacterium]|nr:CoA transferase [Chloroflexota bacterium]
MPESALTGVKVLAFEQAAAGPFATHLLADMGADVIKIERPGTGDVVRGWDRAVHGLSSGYVWLNRRKRSVTVDVKIESGCRLLQRLAEQSDVFVTNFTPGAAEKLGLGYDDLELRNPALIYCAVSGYGLDGPYRDVKAYDLLIQGEAGVLATTGYPGMPAKVGIPISDISAGMYAALAVVMALYQRERTGRGQMIDVSMFESTLSWLGYFPHHYWHQGVEPELVGMRHHFNVPYGPYLAHDEKYVNLSVASASDWDRFCRLVIERPALLNDERFSDGPGRCEHRGILEPLVEQVIMERDSDEWIERLKAADLPWGRVRGIAEVLAHPQVAARRLIREIDSPVGRIPTIESALRMSESPVVEGPLPSLGGDTDAVLREAGYSDDEIAALHAEGAI